MTSRIIKRGIPLVKQIMKSQTKKTTRGGVFVAKEGLKETKGLNVAQLASKAIERVVEERSKIVATKAPKMVEFETQRSKPVVLRVNRQKNPLSPVEAVLKKGSLVSLRQNPKEMLQIKSCKILEQPIKQKGPNS